MNLDNLNDVQARPLDRGRRYFETMAWFESSDSATAAGMALAAIGYTWEQTPYVFDEEDGVLLTSTVYGVISGHTELDEGVAFGQLREIVAPLGGCDSYGFADAPSTQAERYKAWTGGNLADVQRAAPKARAS
jgi:hypothetical protein